MIILLIGLPGSGKTWYAQNVLEYDIFIDDPRSPDDFPRDINLNDTMVIADPMLCVSHELAYQLITTTYPGHSVKKVFFENNPVKCNKNVGYRAKNGDKRKVNVTADFLASKYSIPNNVKIIPIWSPK